MESYSKKLLDSLSKAPPSEERLATTLSDFGVLFAQKIIDFLFSTLPAKTKATTPNASAVSFPPITTLKSIALAIKSTIAQPSFQQLTKQIKEIIITTKQPYLSPNEQISHEEGFMSHDEDSSDSEEPASSFTFNPKKSISLSPTKKSTFQRGSSQILSNNNNTSSNNTTNNTSTPSNNSSLPPALQLLPPSQPGLVKEQRYHSLYFHQSPQELLVRISQQAKQIDELQQKVDSRQEILTEMTYGYMKELTHLKEMLNNRQKSHVAAQAATVTSSYDISYFEPSVIVDDKVRIILNRRLDEIKQKFESILHNERVKYSHLQDDYQRLQLELAGWKRHNDPRMALRLLLQTEPSPYKLWKLIQDEVGNKFFFQVFEKQRPHQGILYKEIDDFINTSKSGLRDYERVKESLIENLNTVKAAILSEKQQLKKQLEAKQIEVEMAKRDLASSLESLRLETIHMMEESFTLREREMREELEEKTAEVLSVDNVGNIIKDSMAKAAFYKWASAAAIYKVRQVLVEYQKNEQREQQVSSTGTVADSLSVFLLRHLQKQLNVISTGAKSNPGLLMYQMFSQKTSMLVSQRVMRPISGDDASMTPTLTKKDSLLSVQNQSRNTLNNNIVPGIAAIPPDGLFRRVVEEQSTNSHLFLEGGASRSFIEMTDDSYRTSELESQLIALIVEHRKQIDRSAGLEKKIEILDLQMRRACFEASNLKDFNASLMTLNNELSIRNRLYQTIFYEVGKLVGYEDHSIRGMNQKKAIEFLKVVGAIAEVPKEKSLIEQVRLRIEMAGALDNWMVGYVGAESKGVNTVVSCLRDSTLAKSEQDVKVAQDSLQEEHLYENDIGVVTESRGRLEIGVQTEYSEINQPKKSKARVMQTSVEIARELADSSWKLNKNATSATASNEINESSAGNAIPSLSPLNSELNAIDRLNHALRSRQTQHARIVPRHRSNLHYRKIRNGEAGGWSNDDLSNSNDEQDDDENDDEANDTESQSGEGVVRKSVWERLFHDQFNRKKRMDQLKRHLESIEESNWEEVLKILNYFSNGKDAEATDQQMIEANLSRYQLSRWLPKKRVDSEKRTPTAIDTTELSQDQSVSLIPVGANNSSSSNILMQSSKEINTVNQMRLKALKPNPLQRGRITLDSQLNPQIIAPILPATNDLTNNNSNSIIHHSSNTKMNNTIRNNSSSMLMKFKSAFEHYADIFMKTASGKKEKEQVIQNTVEDLKQQMLLLQDSPKQFNTRSQSFTQRKLKQTSKALETAPSTSLFDRKRTPQVSSLQRSEEKPLEKQKHQKQANRDHLQPELQQQQQKKDQKPIEVLHIKPKTSDNQPKVQHDHLSDDKQQNPMRTIKTVEDKPSRKQQRFEEAKNRSLSPNDLPHKLIDVRQRKPHDDKQPFHDKLPLKYANNEEKQQYNAFLLNEKLPGVGINTATPTAAAAAAIATMAEDEGKPFKSIKERRFKSNEPRQPKEPAVGVVDPKVPQQQLQQQQLQQQHPMPRFPHVPSRAAAFLNAPVEQSSSSDTNKFFHSKYSAINGKI